VFIDTAGLREAGDEIEQEGVRRSRESLARAEFILHVLDASELRTSADEKYFAEFAGKKRILVVNKVDLPRKLELALERRAPPRHESPEVSRRAELVLGAPIVDVCCLSGQGIEALKDAIKELVWSGEIRAEMLQVMINSRHQDALTRARAATQRTLEVLRAGETLELAAGELRIAVNAVGEIVGKTTTEDLLDSIFSQFCIGK
jgi:tRNA modification GTPase